MPALNIVNPSQFHSRTNSTFHKYCICCRVLREGILQPLEQLRLVVRVVDDGHGELVCPGVLLLGLAVGDLADQLVVLDLEMALEHLRHHHRTRGLGVNHATAVKLLKNVLSLNILHS